MSTKSERDLLPPITEAKNADEHLTIYITRDLAYRSGITVEHLAADVCDDCLTECRCLACRDARRVIDEDARADADWAHERDGRTA